MESCLAARRGVKRRFQCCTDDSGTIVYFRALEEHSERNLKDLSLQDNVFIPSNFFQQIYFVGCALNLHSIINSGFIPGGQNTQILKWLTWVYQVMQNTCTKHGRDIKTQYLGSTSILLLRKDQHSIQVDRMLSSFKKHFQLVAFRKLFEWKLEKSYTKKYTWHLDRHQRSNWNTDGRENCVQNMLNDQKSGSYLEVFNRNNQLKIQFVSERGDPLSRMTWSVCKMKENVPVTGDRC